MGRPCGERRACPRSQGLDPASLPGCSSPNRNLSSTLPPRFMDSEQTWGCALVIGTRSGCPVAPGHMSACRNQSSNGYPRRLIIWYLLTAVLDTGVHTCLLSAGKGPVETSSHVTLQPRQVGDVQRGCSFLSLFQTQAYILPVRLIFCDVLVSFRWWPERLPRWLSLQSALPALQLERRTRISPPSLLA